MRRSNFFMLFALSFFAACDAERLADEVDEAVEFREVYQCAEYNTKIPADEAGTNTLFGKTMMVTAPFVVDDECRTKYDPVLWGQKGCSIASQGRWSFWYLMQQMAGDTPTAEFTMRLLETFEAPPDTLKINNVALEQRGLIRNLVIKPWREASGCNGDSKWDQQPCPNLKPEFAPLRLLAIANRIDLRPNGSEISPYINLPDAAKTAGEGRFVFGFVELKAPYNNMQASQKLDEAGAKEAQIILEYAMPTASKTRISWAKDWLALNVPTTTLIEQEAYKVKLTAITEGFTTKNKFSGRPNYGNAINNVRTNEIAFQSLNNEKRWSFRQFQLKCPPQNPNCGTNARQLVNLQLDQTPLNNHQDSPELLAFLSANEPAILKLAHVVPGFAANNVPFGAGESFSRKFNFQFQWAFNSLEQGNIDVLKAADVRRMFAISTCNGCHYHETNTQTNQHVKNRAKGSASLLSQFLQRKPLEVFNIPTSDGADSVLFSEPTRRLCELFHTQSGATKTLTLATGHQSL